MDASNTLVNPYQDLPLEEQLLKLCYYNEYVSTKTVASLISRGANINVKCNFGNTPFIYACQNGKKDIVALLLENGADINDKDHHPEG